MYGKLLTSPGKKNKNVAVIRESIFTFDLYYKINQQRRALENNVFRKC